MKQCDITESKLLFNAPPPPYLRLGSEPDCLSRLPLAAALEELEWTGEGALLQFACPPAIKQSRRHGMLECRPSNIGGRQRNMSFKSIVGLGRRRHLAPLVNFVDRRRLPAKGKIFEFRKMIITLPPPDKMRISPTALPKAQQQHFLPPKSIHRTRNWLALPAPRLFLREIFRVGIPAPSAATMSLQIGGTPGGG